MKRPPIPTYKQDLDELERVYKKAFKAIVAQLQAVDPTDLISQELYQSQLQQITKLMNDLNSDSQTWVERVLTDSFHTAIAIQMVSLGQASNLTEAKGKVQFSLLSRQRIQAIVSDTFDEILQATSYMSNQLKREVRSIQAEAIRTAIAQQQGSRDIARTLQRDLANAGFSKNLVGDSWKGIVDARGNRWDLTTYTKMVAKTKIQQTQLEGARIMALENDRDLAIISSHGAKDACRHFENMIVSMFGKTKGYPTLEEVRASGLIFHPNCQHSVHLIGDIEALPENLLKQANRAKETAIHAMSNADTIKAEDNRMRYRELKEKAQRIKEARKRQLTGKS